jgi:hypothetical protein
MDGGSVILAGDVRWPIMMTQYGPPPEWQGDNSGGCGRLVYILRVSDGRCEHLIGSGKPAVLVYTNKREIKKYESYRYHSNEPNPFFDPDALEFYLPPKKVFYASQRPTSIDRLQVVYPICLPRHSVTRNKCSNMLKKLALLSKFIR